MARLHGGRFTPQVPPSGWLPVLSGLAIEGEILTVSAGAWGGNPPPTLTYQWQRCDSGGTGCVPIGGATAVAYTLTSGDVGATIRCVVTGTNPAGQVSATSDPTSVIAASGGGGARTFPDASNTGADPAGFTQTIDRAGGWYNLGNAANPSIVDTEVLGGIYWTGTGTLTLDNVSVDADGTKIWGAINCTGAGNVVARNITVRAHNLGGAQKPKGLGIAVTGSVEIDRCDLSEVCENQIRGGPLYLHDSYFHNIGPGSEPGSGATCHGAGLQINGGGPSGPPDGSIVIQHNMIDEFPGLGFRGGDTGAIYLEGWASHVPQVILDDNFLHGAWAPIVINQSANGVSAALITNNVLVWPDPDVYGSGGYLSNYGTPSVTHTWYGNTIGNLDGTDSGVPVELGDPP